MIKASGKEGSKMKGKVLVVMVAAVALLGAGAALAGIAKTKHDLSVTGGGTIKASGTQQNLENCVWCHTPHFADTDFTGAPLWNKATPTGTYTMYGTTSAGTTPDATPNGITKACLSCHDGASAINSLVNQAGTGEVNAAGALVGFNTTTAGTAVLMPADDRATNIGRDLRNNHPVSIVYTTGNASLRAPDGVAATVAKITGAATVKGESGTSRVECSSCHDPHAASGDTTSSGTTAGIRFLRLGSAVCKACHIK